MMHVHEQKKPTYNISFAPLGLQQLHFFLFSNLIALLTHCTMRGAEAIVGDESHILHYEQTGAAQV